MKDAKLRVAHCLAGIRHEYEIAELPVDVKASAIEVVERLDQLFRSGRQKKETVALLIGSLPIVDHLGPSLNAVREMA